MADPRRLESSRGEPHGGVLRPTHVLRCLVVLVVLLAAGCGSSEGSGESADGGASASASASPSASPSAPPAGSCTPPDGATRKATVLARVDLDGDGSPEDVGLTGAGDPCPGQLVSTVGERSVALALPRREPVVRSAFGVAVPGRDGQLVVTRQDHPRGGFQTRVFALEGDQLVQLQSGGAPLVPFVATDVQEQPVSIDCADGGLAVTRAVAHEPAGVVFAWDVRRTTYALEGASVTRGSTEEIADNVLPARLRRDYPQLEKNAVFPSCRVPAAG